MNLIQGMSRFFSFIFAPLLDELQILSFRGTMLSTSDGYPEETGVKYN